MPDSNFEKFIVPPGEKISLRRDYDASFRPDDLGSDEAGDKLKQGVKKLANLQDKLSAQDTYSVLVIFQALDAAGKDGTIKHVMSGINPQGCSVHSFKAPSTEELDHDYLWRCAKRLPERGRIGIFNRSYYEEVLIVRVHPELLEKQHLPTKASPKLWEQRFEEINNFEKYLVQNGTMIIKFFLNISKEEQKRRFLERIENPDKNWKFSSQDIVERQYWKNYMKAYEECFNHTSTKWAPWYIIPADYKPFARLAVSEIISSKLKEIDPEYPKLSKQQLKQLKSAKDQLLGQTK
jgi:PPK2 family polyphosphate:nucleotide phosphotransferase